MSFPFDPLSGLTEAEPAPGFEADALALAARIFSEEGELARVAYVEDPRGRHLFSVPVPHPSHPRIGDALMRALTAALADNGAVGLAMLAEAWTVATTEEGRRAMPVDLADADGRREVLVATVEHYDLEGGAPRVWRAEIARDARGRASLSRWRRQDIGAVSSGRMIGVLPKRPTGGRA